MIRYINDDQELKADIFIEMANQVWPGSYDNERIQPTSLSISLHGIMISWWAVSIY